MKKYFIVLSILFFLIVLPARAVSYLRSPSDYLISNPVSFSVSASSYDEMKLIYCTNHDFDTWRLRYTQLDGNYKLSDIMASTTISNTFIENLNITDYTRVLYYCYKIGGGTYNIDLEYSGGGIIFSLIISTATSTPINNDIEIISYNATSTAISSTQTTTTGSYRITFFLFLFMAIILFFSLLAVYLIIFLKGKH